MAIKIQNTTVIDDSRGLQNITNLKTIGGQNIIGTGDVLSGGEGQDGQVLTSNGPGGVPTWSAPEVSTTKLFFFVSGMSSQ